MWKDAAHSSYKGNAGQNYNEVPLCIGWLWTKIKVKTNAGNNVEDSEPLSIAGTNVKRQSQFDSSSKS